jgi:hypothetical protein
MSQYRIITETNLNGVNRLLEYEGFFPNRMGFGLGVVGRMFYV